VCTTTKTVVKIFPEMQASQQETRSALASNQPPAAPLILAWQFFAESVLLAALVCFSVFFLQWRYGFNLGDEGWLWYISKRTVLGDVPVRDFFSYDPGRYYWSALIFKLLGRSGFFEQLLANYVFAIIGLTLTYLAMVSAGLSRTWRIVILLLLGIVIGFPRHKIYEQTLSLTATVAVAFLFAAPQRTKRWLLSGVVIGLAAFFGRNSGLFCFIAAVIAFTLLKIRAQQLPIARVITAVTTGILIGYSPMIFMLVFVHGFAHPFFESVLLTPHWAWSLPIPFPWHVHVKGLHGLDLLQARAVSWLCVVVPVTYAFLLWRIARTKHDLERTEWLAVAASCAGVGFLIQAFHTADFFHIAQGVVPFVVAACGFAAHLWMNNARRSSLGVFGIVIFFVIACWLPMEPLVQHLRTEALAPGMVEQIAIDGRNFEVPSEQAYLMRTVQNAFRNCGARDGRFFAAPYYPGLYAFLNTRSPLWDTYFLWPRSESTQQNEIQSLQQNRTALFLINYAFAMNGREGLKLDATNSALLAYITAYYQRSTINLPVGFDLFYDSTQCKNFVQANH
jgi:hypothetical protein